jgi:hypothetical protein
VHERAVEECDIGSRSVFQGLLPEKQALEDRALARAVGAAKDGERAQFQALKPIMLKPGQLITGRHAIAKATGVNNSKVFRILELLKAEQQIEQLAGVKHSLITVLNWRSYQRTEQQGEQQASSNVSIQPQKTSSKSNSYGHAKNAGKTGETSIPGRSSEQETEQRANSNSPKIEHKQEGTIRKERKPPATTAERISLEKELSILQARLRKLEEDTTDRWQQEENPHLVQAKQNLRAEITGIENLLLE